MKLSYMTCDEETYMRSLMLDDAASKQLKFQLLARLGIEGRLNESPLDAWLRYICEANGFEFSKPAPAEVANAILSDREASRFMFFLA